MGYDQKKSLGDGMEGSAVALPIWRTIMQAWAARRRAELTEPPAFERPGNIVIVATGDAPMSTSPAPSRAGRRRGLFESSAPSGGVSG